MIFAAVDPGLVTTLAGALLAGGGGGALYAYRKAKPEAEAITSATLIEVNEFLRKELRSRDEEIEALRKRLADLRRDFDALEAEFQKITSGSHR